MPPEPKERLGPDALENLLVDQYGMSEDRARAYAADIHAGKAPEGKGLETQAYAKAGIAAKENLEFITSRLERFKRLHQAVQEGYNLTPEDNAFYKAVRRPFDEDIQAKAAASEGQLHGDLQDAANREITRMGAMGDYARGFSPHNYQTETLSPGGMQVVPKSREGYEQARLNEGKAFMEERRQVRQRRAGAEVPPQDQAVDPALMAAQEQLNARKALRAQAFAAISDAKRRGEPVDPAHDAWHAQVLGAQQPPNELARLGQLGSTLGR